MALFFRFGSATLPLVIFSWASLIENDHLFDWGLWRHMKHDTCIKHFDQAGLTLIQRSVHSKFSGQDNQRSSLCVGLLEIFNSNSFEQLCSSSGFSSRDHHEHSLDHDDFYARSFFAFAHLERRVMTVNTRFPRPLSPTFLSWPFFSLEITFTFMFAL